MKHSFMDDDEEMNGNAVSGHGLLNSSSNQNSDYQGNDAAAPGMCGCLSVQYYQPYFDVDTVDVTSRVTNSTIYCGRQEQFLTSIEDKPDLYGPFWIATSLIFSVAVSSHISNWLSSWMTGENWVYDFQSIVTAATIVYGYMFLVPFVVYFMFRQLGCPDMSLVLTICLYGYSLGVFIPASLVCILPSPTIIWLTLMAASISSSVFLIRNMMPKLPDNAQQSAQTVMGIIGVCQVVFMATLKLSIY